jgi:hypothetical protein
MAGYLDLCGSPTFCRAVKCVSYCWLVVIQLAFGRTSHRARVYCRQIQVPTPIPRVGTRICLYYTHTHRSYRMVKLRRMHYEGLTLNEHCESCILYNQRDAAYTMFLISMGALHVSGGISPHHEKFIKLYVQPWVLSWVPTHPHQR